MKGGNRFITFNSRFTTCINVYKICEIMKITMKQKLLILFFVVLTTIGASVFFRIPVNYSLILPIQHFTNMLMAVLLGPWYAVAGAFSISLFRNMIGTGSIFAFPGSMVGALLAGLLFMKTRKVSYAFFGEVIGTGIIGAFLAYLIGLRLLEGEATLLSFITPYLFSSLLGAIMAYSMFKILSRNKVFGNLFK